MNERRRKKVAFVSVCANEGVLPIFFLKPELGMWIATRSDSSSLFCKIWTLVSRLWEYQPHGDPTSWPPITSTNWSCRPLWPPAAAWFDHCVRINYTSICLPLDPPCFFPSLSVRRPFGRPAVVRILPQIYCASFKKRLHTSFVVFIFPSGSAFRHTPPSPTKTLHVCVSPP